MLTGPDPIQWTCHICGRMRDDADIAVHTHSLEPVPGVWSGFKENVRYCRDNAACVAAAPTYSFFKRAQK